MKHKLVKKPYICELGKESAITILVRKMNDALFIRVFLLLFKHCFENMPSLHNDLQTFPARVNCQW